MAAFDSVRWESIWKSCWWRVRRLTVPPRWTARDWWDEAQSQGALAACQALGEFDHKFGVPCDVYLRRRVWDAVWTRYRQECSYGRRHATFAEDAHEGEASGDVCHHDPTCIPRLLEQLDQEERWLVQQWFWLGKKDAEVASALGVSRQAINRRKLRLISKIRRNLVR